MVIEKVINNNIVSAYDKDGREVVIMGRGIGFGVRPGAVIRESKIEKIFRMESRSAAEQLKELLVHMPLEHVQISDDIISFAKSTLKLKLNQSIYVTLTDHINFAIDRYKKGINLENALLWEIKRFYPQEYELGKYSIRLIKDRLHLELPEDEAGFIALHFVNAEYGTDIRDALHFPNQMKDILAIVTEELGIELDEGTLHYERFVTHIKFLIQRIYRSELLEDQDQELGEMMRRKYPREYQCSRRIAAYIGQETGHELSGDEIMNLPPDDLEDIFLALNKLDLGGDILPNALQDVLSQVGLTKFTRPEEAMTVEPAIVGGDYFYDLGAVAGNMVSGGAHPGRLRGGLMG